MLEVPPHMRECEEHSQNSLTDLVMGISITGDGITYCSFHALGVPVRLERIMRSFTKLMDVSRFEVEISLDFCYALHVLRYGLGVPTQSSELCDYLENLHLFPP